MKKNIAMLRKIGGLGLAGAFVLGAGQAQSATFDVTTDVQNTLAVTVVQGMSLGTLYAASANSSAVSTLTLKPDGTYGGEAGFEAVNTSGATVGPPLISLGGEAAARASVATGEDFTVTLPDAKPSSTLTESDFADADGPLIPVSIAGGDPGVARFYLGNFTVGDATVPDDEFNQVVGENTVSFTPGFGVENVEFGIGATIYTDGSGARTAYEEGVYEGSFVVEAAY